MKGIDNFPTPENPKELDIKKLKPGTLISINLAEGSKVEQFVLRLERFVDSWPVITVIKGPKAIELGHEYLVGRNGLIKQGEDIFMRANINIEHSYEMWTSLVIDWEILN